MKTNHYDVEVGYSNGYRFELYYRPSNDPNKNGDEHTPPHLHAYYNGRKGKFCICNSYKGRIGDMYDGTMKPQEQAFVKKWIIQHKSQLNRRWRSQNFTHIDTALTAVDDLQRLNNAIHNIEYILRKLRIKLILRKMESVNTTY